MIHNPFLIVSKRCQKEQKIREKLILLFGVGKLFVYRCCRVMARHGSRKALFFKARYAR